MKENDFLWLHRLVPRHRLLSPDEAETKLSEIGADATDLPKILLNDPAVQALDEEVKVGDIIEVARESVTAGLHYAYRRVVEQ